MFISLIMYTYRRIANIAHVNVTFIWDGRDKMEQISINRYL
jgi:hypothetical protein